MSEFLFLAGVHRAQDPDGELLEMSLDLARPRTCRCTARYVSPDGELAALKAAPQA